MSVAPVTPTAGIQSALPTTSSGSDVGRAGNNIFAKLVQGANEQQLAADKEVGQLAAGETDSLHQVVLTAAKADLSFRLVLELRNKLMESWQEIMRMQV